MKISKLLIENVYGCTIEELEGRRAGSSTGTALKIIGQAMLSPEYPISIHEVDNTVARDLSLVDLVHSILAKLELKYFKVNKSARTITYYPFIEID